MSKQCRNILNFERFCILFLQNNIYGYFLGSHSVESNCCLIYAHIYDLSTNASILYPIFINVYLNVLQRCTYGHVV